MYLETGSVVQSDIVATSGAYKYGFAHFSTELPGMSAPSCRIFPSINTRELTRYPFQRATSHLPYLPSRPPTKVHFRCWCAARAELK
jgi:hypothetical protein